ncbi:MAG: TIGR01212 family radical SAM protein [Desulfamplus sp.]|nr:TIGR01212 family radical SAM protein [Desulfamplus sp.]
MRRDNSGDRCTSRDEATSRNQVTTGDGGTSRNQVTTGDGCIYCNSRGSGSGMWKKGLSITEQIEDGKRAMERRYKAKKFLVYFQSYTNTYTTCEKMTAMFDEALAVDSVVGMAIGTRPDCVDPEKIALIASYTREYLVWLEYGVQSSHDRTLQLINRGHDFDCFLRAVELTRGTSINVCAHIILGLPGENRDMMIETAKRIGDAGIHGVKIHLLYVIKDTPLGKMYSEGRYECLSMDGYAELVCDVIEHMPENVVIQRITGDPHPHELMAPMWAMDKQQVFKTIRNRLEERDIRQGNRLIY